MARGIMVVQSSPVSPDQEDAFNDWYDNVHVPEICAVPGFVSARRYKIPGAPGYLAIYEIEADDLAGPPAEWHARSAAGRTTGTRTLQLDPPPVVTVYELLP
ncbi:MAG: hypothetical protein J2P28_15935 [Actinobacteria bacterium]|nr:hypothetical protein [Actinomycetota bacterium]